MNRSALFGRIYRGEAGNVESVSGGGGGFGGAEGGTAMNISPAHLFMQYFALAALRQFSLSPSLSIFLPTTPSLRRPLDRPTSSPVKPVPR